MLFNAIGHGGGLFALAGIISPHHPLQFGELVDHLADQICFGQVGCLLHQELDMPWQVQLPPDHLGNLLDPPHLIPQGSQSIGKGDRIQLGHQTF